MLAQDSSSSPTAFLGGLVEQVVAEVASGAGQRIGPYRVLGVLGSGGMGSVYRAVRDDGVYEKEVAIKVLQMGLDTPHARARFRQERQILAGLEHPSIARLIDGGETGAGLPYLVLELVDGQDIVTYCAARGLSVEARLRLFVEVCAAVQAAHQSFIVHRDLKPGNILVTVQGAGEAAGLRHRQAAGFRRRTYGHGADRADPAVCQPGACARRGDHHIERCVLAGRGAVPVAHRRGAVRDPDHGSDGHRSRGVPDRAGAGGRVRGHRQHSGDGAAQGAGAALCERAGTGRRHRAFA